jgi:hypothetical protein
MLGFVCLGIISSGLPDETSNLILAVMIFTISILNIVIITGSTVQKGFMNMNGNANPFSWSSYLIIKAITALLNITVFVFIFLSFKNHYPRVSGYVTDFLTAFISATYLLSALRIIVSKWSRFAGFRRTFIVTVICLAVLGIGSFITMRIIIGQSIRKNIEIAKAKYPGNAEDALIAFLSDTTNSPSDRTHIAVWTLGQIRSEKSLPYLEKLYRNDPQGKTCRHYSEVCQYELHKAIVSVEHRWLGAEEKNWFGSWSRLNK